MNYLELIVRWLACRVVGHRWEYFNMGEFRRCHRCGKQQRARYDMMYGSTDWE